MFYIKQYILFRDIIVFNYSGDFSSYFTAVECNGEDSNLMKHLTVLL